jgi:hypothetical protein
LYSDVTIEGNKIIGSPSTPKVALSRNICYMHSIDEIKAALKQQGLCITTIKEYGFLSDEVALFILIYGTKISQAVQT